MNQYHSKARAGLLLSIAIVFSTTSLATLHAQVSPSTQVLNAASNPTTQAADQADALIKTLGSEDASERDAAQQKLVNLGSEVAGKLTQAASKNEDPEIRSRAAAALARINNPPLNQPDVTKPSLITLHESLTPFDKVLESIGKQANAKIVGSAGANGPVNFPITIDVDQKPYWEVISDLCNRLNYCPDAYEFGNDFVRLFPDARDWIAKSPHQIVGPYWVGVSGVYRNRAIELMGPPTIHDDVSIKIRVFPEPRLAVMRLSDLVVSEAVDDLGNSMLIRNMRRGAVANNHDPRTVNYTIESHLAYPEKPGTRISRLGGEISVVLAQDHHQYLVDNLLDHPKTANPFPDDCIELKCDRSGDDVFHISLQCKRSGFTDDQWLAVADQLTDLSLRDAQGRLLILTGGGLTTASVAAGGETILVSGTFLRQNLAHPGGLHAGPPVKLLWNVPGAFKSAVVKVLLKDIPMP